MNTEKEMSKRQLRRAKIRQSEMRSRMLTIGLVVIGALLIAFVLIYPNVKPMVGVVTAEPRSHPQANKNSLGDPNAPVKIEEFSSFQCSHCKDFHDQTEAQLVETYVETGKVNFIFRSLGSGTAESAKANTAVYCAGDQNKLWEMKAAIFANWLSQDVFTDRWFVSLAETVDLDMKQFNSCYNGNKHADQMEQDVKDADAAGLTGTPFFVLSYTDASGKTITKMIEGAQPFDVFQKEIEAALALAGK